MKRPSYWSKAKERPPDPRLERMAETLPEEVTCPELGRRVKRSVCVGSESLAGCDRLLGRCAATLDYIPTESLQPVLQGVCRDSGLSPGQILAKVEADEHQVESVPLADNQFEPRRPIELDEETQALLRTRWVRGRRYATDEERREATRRSTRLSNCRREVVEAAQAGDAARLARAKAVLENFLAKARAEVEFKSAIAPPRPEPRPLTELRLVGVYERADAELYLKGLAAVVGSEAGARWRFDVLLKRVEKEGSA